MSLITFETSEGQGKLLAQGSQHTSSRTFPMGIPLCACTAQGSCTSLQTPARAGWDLCPGQALSYTKQERMGRKKGREAQVTSFPLGSKQQTELIQVQDSWSGQHGQSGSKSCSQMLPTASAAGTAWKGFQIILQLLSLLLAGSSLCCLHNPLHSCIALPAFCYIPPVGCWLCHLDGIQRGFGLSQVVQNPAVIIFKAT